MVKWRQRSDEAKITSPKSERWANARKILSELELIFSEEALLAEQGESKATAVSPNLVTQQSNLVTKSENDYASDLVAKSNRRTTESVSSVVLQQLDSVTKSEGPPLNDLVTESITPNSSLLELVTKTKEFDIDGDENLAPNQLNLLREAEYQGDNFKPEVKELASLTRVELAERFGIKVDSLGNRVTGKMASTFSEWSKKRDPDGITWQYYPDTKLFFPVNETVTNPETESVSELGS